MTGNTDRQTVLSGTSIYWYIIRHPYGCTNWVVDWLQHDWYCECFIKMVLDEITWICDWILYCSSINLVTHPILIFPDSFWILLQFLTGFLRLAWVPDTFMWSLGVSDLTSVTCYGAGSIVIYFRLSGKLEHCLLLVNKNVLYFHVYRIDWWQGVISHP